MVLKHKIYNCSLSEKGLNKDSVDLIVTSPPYPMISMWDDCFLKQNPLIQKYMGYNMPENVYLEMHRVLENVWCECIYALKPGGFICINIGDATKSYEHNFRIFSNHSKIIEFFIKNGCYMLPSIIWKKPTNSPNKFMGSGMLPCGAYVTLEHEYILIFRKGEKRKYTLEEKEIRQRSGYFYNERNIWFSDLWDVKGVSQIGIVGSRERSGAYPLEIPLRLINMFSIQGDTVLDPFCGLGTTMIAGIFTGRNTVNYEIDPVLSKYILDRVLTIHDWNSYNIERLKNQNIDVENAKKKGKKLYKNENMNIEVRTKQECKIILPSVLKIEVNRKKNEVTARYL